MRAAWLEIDLDAIRGNIRCIRRQIGPERRIAAVVKGNAYGHGMLEVARASLEAGASTLCVAIVGEAAQLRNAGIDAPILVLGPPCAGEAGEYVRLGVTATVSNIEHARIISDAAARAGSTAEVHVKIDSGMGRHGARPGATEELADALQRDENLRVTGVFSHFADCTNEDLVWSEEQLRRFRAVLPVFEARFGSDLVRHMANSAAIMRMPEAHFDMVRPGTVLYGMNSGFPVPEAARGIRPALSLRCQIAGIKTVERGEPVGYGCTWRAPRDSRIAVLPLGYADGYARALSNTADVLISGRRCRLVGRVSMDALTIDVTDVEARPGDEAVLIGAQGDEAITVEELAARAGSIVEEIATRLTNRLPRVYLNKEAT